MPNNPKFELDQIHRYLDHLSADPAQLARTAESNFFPVLQRIFLREGFEVRRNVEVRGRSYPFQLIDLDQKRTPVIVDFSFSSDPKIDEFEDNRWTMIPGPILEALEDSSSNTMSWLVLRDALLHPSMAHHIGTYGDRLKFLDFEGLKSLATSAFEVAERRDTHRAVAIVRDMVVQLIQAVAGYGIELADIEWRDMERLVHETLRGLGIPAHLTPPARDGGRDIVACDILVDDVHWYNIEVKHWRARNVGSAQASACLETAIREGRKGALLISTGGAGPAAMSVRSEAHRDYLRFGEEQKVVLTCKHYVANAAGLWQPIRDFRTFLLDQTV